MRKKKEQKEEQETVQIRVWATTHREIRLLAAELGVTIAEAVDTGLRGARDRLTRERQHRQ